MWSKPNGTCPDSIFLRHLQYPKTSQLFPSQHTSVCVPLQGGSSPGVHSQVQASIGLWVCRAVTFKPRHPYGSTHTAVHLAKSDEDPGANSWETSWHQYLSLWVPGMGPRQAHSGWLLWWLPSDTCSILCEVPTFRATWFSRIKDKNVLKLMQTTVSCQISSSTMSVADDC